MDKKINLRDLFAKAFGAEKLDVGAGLGIIVGAGLGIIVGAGLGIIVGAGLGIIVGAGLGTQFKYPPIMEQQNPPIPPPKGNRLIRNWTTQPTLFSTAIAVKDWGRAGFV